MRDISISVRESDAELLGELGPPSVSCRSPPRPGLTGHQSWAIFCRMPPLAGRIPRGAAGTKNWRGVCNCGKQERCTNSWGLVLGQQHTGQQGATKKNSEAQNSSVAEENALAPLQTRGSISKPMKALVGGSATGSAKHRRQWTTALIPRSSGGGTHPTESERTHETLAEWREEAGTKRHEEPLENRAVARQG